MSAVDPTWLELRITVPGGEDDAEAELRLAPLTGVCLRLSPDGVVIEGPDAPPGPHPPPPEGHQRCRIFVDPGSIEEARALLEAEIAPIEGSTLEVLPLADDWRERWKEWFHGFEISERLAVRPPWEEREVHPGQRVVVVEPGMAFGTGQHETTQLCLRQLDRHYAAGNGARDVLDVGCGTGILAIAAALLGAEQVTAIDNDPVAVRTTAENARHNGVSEVVVASGAEVGALGRSWPLVVANILAHVLIALREELADATASGGLLCLSGILAEQAGEVVGAFEGVGFRLMGREDLSGWVRLDFSR